MHNIRSCIHHLQLVAAVAALEYMLVAAVDGHHHPALLQVVAAVL